MEHLVQISMNVQVAIALAMPMQVALTQMVHMFVHVKADTLEMGYFVRIPMNALV